MNAMQQDIQSALLYMEAHLLEEMSIRDLAQRACLSEFYFQRMFSALCGMGAGEYIRCRRLSLAAQELCTGQARVVDIALKYGYDSPVSFARAFSRFHGVSPSQAKKRGTQLRSFTPLELNLSPKGGSMLEYKIVQKPQFTLMGVRRRFHSETSYRDIPEYWKEVMPQYTAAGLESALCLPPDAWGKKPQLLGMYGICIDDGSESGMFDYFIADNYIPWADVPDGCETFVVPASLWAVFPCRGALPQALQTLNTKIVREWLPALECFTLAGKYNVETYAMPAEKPEDTYCEIWIPVRKLPAEM